MVGAISDGGDGRLLSSSLIEGVHVVHHRVASVHRNKQQISHCSSFCCNVAVGDMAPRMCVIMKMGGRVFFAYRI